MIKAVERDEISDTVINDVKFVSSKKNKLKRKVRKDYYCDHNPLFFAGFLLLMIAAFIFITVVKITDSTTNLINDNLDPKIDEKSEIVNSKDSESKNTEINTHTRETQS